MAICGFCSSAINIRKPNIFCSFCKKQFHSSCVYESTDISQLLEKVAGLSWKCGDCRENCATLNQADLTTMLNNKVQDALATLNSTFASLKNDIIKLTADKLSCIKEPDAITEQYRYSDVVKNKSQPAVIIRPKNQSQSNLQTKAEIKNKINPADVDIQLSKVKNIKNGGILIGCRNKDDNEKLKKIAVDRLSDQYEIKEFQGLNPRVRVVGITDKYEEDELLEYIKKLNADLFALNTVCKLVKLIPTKKNKNVFQAILQLDHKTYDRVIKAGNLFVGYDNCAVFDAIEISRCFTCNEFHHLSRSCQKPISCPRCGQNHEIKSCKSDILCCSNCLKLKDVSTDHAVWDVNKCTAYIRAKDKVRNDILAVK